MATMASFFPSGSASAWEGKVWSMLAEACAAQADRNNMSYGAGEPFVDASDLTLTNAVVESGYVRNTVTAASAGENWIPVLTSNTSNGLAFATSEYDTAHAACKAFDSDTSITLWASSYSWVGTQYLGYVSSAADKTVAAYTISPHSNLTQAPGTWTFQISSDTTTGFDGTWTTVDTQTGVVWSTQQSKSYTLSAAQTGVKGIRLAITGTQAGSSTPINVASFAVLSIGSAGSVNAATIDLASVPLTSPTAGKIIFTGYNADAAAILDVGNSGSNKVEVYPMISGSAGSALAFTNESLGSNKWRFTSPDISIAGATSFGVRFKSFARSIAPNFRLYEAIFVWR